MRPGSRAAPATAPGAPHGAAGGGPLELIDLGRGQPGTDLLPFRVVAEAGAVALQRRDPELLQYGAERGPLGLREAVAAWLSRRAAGAAATATRGTEGGVDLVGAPGPDELVITSGITVALDLLCTLLAEPGGVVLVEEPTYHLAKLIFRDHRLRQVSVAGDEGGMLPEALDEALARHPGALVYLVPAFGNPTGASLSAARARRVLEVTERHGAWLLADEVYRLLDFGAGPAPSLARRGAERVVSLNSFSKVLAPGLRLGWLVAPPPLLRTFETSGLLQSGGGLNPLVGAVVEHALRAGGADEHLDMLRGELARRAAALGAALRRHLPAAEFAAPAGGYFIWLRVPGAASTGGALLERARAGGVGFVPGSAFSTAGGQGERLRLSFAHYDPARLELGVERLAVAVESANVGGHGRRSDS